MRNHILLVIALWAVISLAGYVLVLNIDLFPVAASDQAKTVDDAFVLLLLLAVPVFAFVVAVLVYSGFRFRSRGAPAEDGPAIRSHRPTIVVWLGLSTALTVAMIIHPGITGVNELRAHDGKEVDLVVQVEGTRFAWFLTYPEQRVKSRKELVLPIGAVTRFKITSRDVIHSLWIPAFRVKIDAVPGRTTSVVATPNRIGTYDQDVNYRIQCAELCGLGHAGMSLPVRVVEQAEFDAWISQQTTLD